MPDAWTAERVVDAELARALLAAQFPELAGASLAPLGTGWDNTAWLVAGSWVFRFPRRPIAVPLIEREIALLPAIAPRVPLPIPVPEKAGRPEERFPWPWAGHRLVPGRTADSAALADDARAAAAVPLARFLAALHAFPPGEAAALGAGGDDIGRLDVAARGETARAALSDLRGRGVLDTADVARVERVLDGARAPASAPAPARTLVHGDLYARHLLVDGAGRLAGVIDWGDVHLGGPAVDLSVAHRFLPPGARDAFRRAYGPIDEATWRLAGFRAAAHAARTLLYAVCVGDTDLAREERRTLGGLD